MKGKFIVLAGSIGLAASTDVLAAVDCTNFNGLLEYDMNEHNISHRKAVLDDLGIIVNLLFEDELGKARENSPDIVDQDNIDAFKRISADAN